MPKLTVGNLKSSPAPWEGPTSCGSTLLVLLAFMIALVAAGYFYTQDDANSNSRLALVKAFVEEHRYEIDSYQAGALKTADEAFYNGHSYTDKAIGSSLVGIEFYSLIFTLHGGLANPLPLQLFKRLMTLLAISLLCAFLAPLLYSFAGQLSSSRRYAFLVAIAICVGTPFYVYSAAYYGHSLAGLFVFAGFFVWFTMRKTGNLHPLKVFCSGCLLGYAVITEFPTVLIAAVIGCYALYVMWKFRGSFNLGVCAALITGVAIPGCTLMLYNHAVFGNPLAVSYGYEAVGAFRAAQATGFMGIGAPDLGALFYTTFHTTMGLFWQSPVLLLALPGWVAMWQRDEFRLEALLSAFIVILYFIVLSGYSVWWGGLAFTPRYLIPALPFFAIPLAFLPGRLRRAALVLTAISVLQMLLVVATLNEGLGKITIAYSQGLIYRMFQNSTIYGVYLPNFLAGKLAPNLGYELFGLTGYLSLVPLVLVEVSLFAAFFLLSRAQGGSQNIDR